MNLTSLLLRGLVEMPLVETVLLGDIIEIKIKEMKSILIILTIMLGIFSCTIKPKTAKFSNFEIVSPPDLNPNNNDEIGFKCGGGGEGTILVKEFSKIIKDKNYIKLKEGLYSQKPGTFYLATISCEILAKEGMINLNKTELNQIKKNKIKTDTVYTCSGCTEFESFAVKQLLNDTSNYIRMEAGWWFDEILGKNIIRD